MVSLLAASNLYWIIPLLGGLLILSILRPRQTRQVVSTLYLWRRIQAGTKADAPFQKIKLNLLFILQLLALLLLALALARPFIPAAGRSSTTTAIIIDVSASMNAVDVSPSRLDAAKAAAIEYLRSHSRDRFVVISAGAVPELLCPPTYDAALAESAVESAQPADTVADIHGSITVAATRLRGDRTAGAIVYSDGAWSPDADLQIEQLLPGGVQLVRIGTSNAANAGIVALTERPEPLDPDQRRDILVTVQQSGVPAERLRVMLDGKQLITRALEKGPGNHSLVLDDPALGRGGLVTATLLHGGRDDFRGDDQASIQLPSLRTLKILLVSASDEYLDHALSLQPGAALSECMPSQYSASNATNYDLVVFDGFVPEALPRGNYLVFGASSRAMPVTPAAQNGGSPAVVDWDRGDPLMRFVDLSGLHVQQALTVQAASWGRVVADGSNGPLVVAGEQDGRRIVWVGFQPSESDFPLSIDFPIFLTNAVEWLRSRPHSEEECIRTGSPLTLPSGLAEWVVKGPHDRLTLLHCSSGAPCVDYQTDQAGVYIARSSTGGITIPINIASIAESEITPQDHPALTGSPEDARTMGINVDYWPLLAEVAILLIVGEWLAYNRGRS